MKRLLRLVAVLLLLGVGCSSNKISAPQTYTNSFLQIALELPVGWYVGGEKHKPHLYVNQECAQVEHPECTRIEISEALKLVTGGIKTFEDGLKRNKTSYTIVSLIPNATVFKIISNIEGYTNQYYTFFPQEERVFMAYGASDEGDKKIEDVLATLRILK